MTSAIKMCKVGGIDDYGSGEIHQVVILKEGRVDLVLSRDGIGRAFMDDGVYRCISMMTWDEGDVWLEVYMSDLSASQWDLTSLKKAAMFLKATNAPRREAMAA